MRQIFEIVLVTVVFVAAFPLDWTRFLILAGALLGVYFLTMHNSFNEGYSHGYADAESDRVY